MSETSHMSTDRFESTGLLPHKGGVFLLSPDSLCMSVSPDSGSSISNLSEREASVSPDINMECCVDECASVGNFQNATLAQDDLLSVVSSNMNQTFIATPVNGSINFWNESLSHISNGKSDGEVMCPDSVRRDRQLSSCETSCRGSSENDCCSLSSGEMVVRSNSFCLEEQSLIAISSLEESSMSSAASRLQFPTDSNLLSTTLPDTWEISPKRVMEENTAHPCLGVTFTQADNLELLTEENDKAPSSSIVALPNESGAGLLMTFICESSTDLIKEAKSGSSETELLVNFLGPITPEQGKTFVSTMSPMQGHEDDIHTSTPVQNTGNKTPSLPSLSPCVSNASSPGLQLVKRQQTSLTPKQHPVARLPSSLSKVKKIEIQKNPKSALGRVKSKVPTMASHHVAVPGHDQALQRKQMQVNGSNKPKEVSRRTNVRISPTKVTSGTAAVSATSKILYDAPGHVGAGGANLSVTNRQSFGRNVVHGQSKTRASPPDHQSAANEHASAETMQAGSHQGSQTCASSLEKSPRSGQMDPKPTPRKDVSAQIEVRSGSALGQDKPLICRTRPRCSSESSSTSRPPKKRTTLRVATSFSVCKADANQGLNRPEKLNCSTQNKLVEETRRPSDDSPREVKKISLVAEPNKSRTAGEPCDESKSRSHGRPSPKRGRGTLLSQPPPASPRPTPLPAQQRQANLGRVDCRVSRTAGTPQRKNNAGSQSAQATAEPSVGIKPQLNGSWPTRPSLMGPPLTPSCRQPRKTQGPSRGLSDCSVNSESGQGTRFTPVSGGAAQKPTPIKHVVLKARIISTPGKTLTTACKPAAPAGKGASNSTVTPLKRTTSARFVRPTLGGHVDKSKSKASSRQQSSQPSTGPQNVVQASVPPGERKDQNIQQLLTASNCRFQAVAIVLQQTLAERDEAAKQCRQLSQELLNLRGELVCSVHSSERLQKEKEELHVALEDALQKLQEQHQKEQTEVERRLQAFYQDEWGKVRLTYQEEVDKCKTLMQQQMEELKANHEAMKLELESSHEEQLQCVKQQYEIKLEELGEVHSQELQSLDRTLKDAEAALSGQIQKLTEENNALIEKLAAEENRRKELAENSQDPHTLYLEQELESLQVVLEIKTEQLHQQEKKLMEIGKLTEKNVKLDESLKKVQQENEDLKARMEKHAALSRQLSTEQAMLQESLQKESKVNKRLSMENEELHWKLHNGDLSSPRKSPTSTSPSHSTSLHSPRSSDPFSSPPISPR
ncbi:microtubule-associated tumor suppressor 1 homolog A isoform X2 [Leuresthes tenuis]|uniref:microtubule-associated tumor suppressor 1 homolog A isoform X2 n=1 Tax=Leuresthes tenuis TaxID=355514 RepID=UPI003B501700